MTREEICCEIVKIISKAQEALREIHRKAYESASGPSSYRLMFPEYADRRNRQNKIRKSEQELRFEFVEQFFESHAFKDWHYSIETPTSYKYTSAHKGCPKIGGVRSGKIDMTLYDEEGNATVFIEFKYGSLGADNKNLEYDVIKLIAETSRYDCCLGYSLNLVDDTGDAISEQQFNDHYLTDKTKKAIIQYIKNEEKNTEDELKKQIDRIEQSTERIFYKAISLK